MHLLEKIGNSRYNNYIIIKTQVNGTVIFYIEVTQNIVNIWNLKPFYELVFKVNTIFIFLKNNINIYLTKNIIYMYKKNSRYKPHVSFMG